MSDFEHDIIAGMDIPRPKTTPIPPKRIASAVAEATDPNTSRATDNMIDQMQKIADGLEREIKDTKDVRTVVDERITNLQYALDATMNSLKMLRDLQHAKEE